MVFGVWCLVFGVWGLFFWGWGSGVWGLTLEFWVWGLGSGVSGFGCRLWGSECDGQRSGSRVKGVRFRGFVLRVSQIRFRDSGFRFWASGLVLRIQNLGIGVQNVRFRGEGLITDLKNATRRLLASRAESLRGTQEDERMRERGRVC